MSLKSVGTILANLIGPLILPLLMFSSCPLQLMLLLHLVIKNMIDWWITLLRLLTPALPLIIVLLLLLLHLFLLLLIMLFLLSMLLLLLLRRHPHLRSFSITLKKTNWWKSKSSDCHLLYNLRHYYVICLTYFCCLPVSLPVDSNLPISLYCYWISTVLMILSSCFSDKLAQAWGRCYI